VEGERGRKIERAGERDKDREERREKRKRKKQSDLKGVQY